MNKPKIAREVWRVNYGLPVVTSTNCTNKILGHRYRKVLKKEAEQIKIDTGLSGCIWQCTTCGKVKSSM